MYGQTYKDSWGIIASPLSGTFRLSLARCSTPFGFPNAYEFVYESDEISYPGSGKIVAKFFNEPGVVARHLFTIEVPVTVCRGLNYKSYDPNNYKFYSLTEMLTPQYESFGGSTRVSVSAGVGKTSTTFVCSGQASSSRSYVAVGGVNAYDGQANDAAEGASPPCVVWSFDPTSTDAITAPNAQGYGYLRHYQPNMYGWTELSRSDVTTGQNAVTVSSVDFDCNSLQKGACCEGTTCTVKPQCQCQGTEQTFKGVGTTCTPNPCLCCTGGRAEPSSLLVEITAVEFTPPVVYSLSISMAGSYVVPKTSCLNYSDWFYVNAVPCGASGSNSFGLTRKLRITLLSGTGLIEFVVCDSDGTYMSSPQPIGGNAYGYISGLNNAICNGSFPIVGTTTSGNPQAIGIITSVSYRITAA
jgi:hypothetical protein